jgi:hypothetical protein
VYFKEYWQSAKGKRPTLNDDPGAIIAFPGETFGLDRQNAAGRPG